MSENETQKLRDLLLQAKSLIDNLLAYVNPPIKTVQELIATIPEDLRPLITIEEAKEHFTVRPKQYLGADNFSRLLEALRQHGGKWISEGKDSRFEIPRRS